MEKKEFNLADPILQRSVFEIADGLEILCMQLSLLEILSYIYNDKQDYKQPCLKSIQRIKPSKYCRKKQMQKFRRTRT